jgi:hypothetical protein
MPKNGVPSLGKPKDGVSFCGGGEEECRLRLLRGGGVSVEFGRGAMWAASADPGSMSRPCLAPGNGLGVSCGLAGF